MQEHRNRGTQLTFTRVVAVHLLSRERLVLARSTLVGPLEGAYTYGHNVNILKSDRTGNRPEVTGNSSK